MENILVMARWKRKPDKLKWKGDWWICPLKDKKYKLKKAYNELERESLIYCLRVTVEKGPINPPIKEFKGMRWWSMIARGGLPE